jgi:hypothetical protein
LIRSTGEANCLLGRNWGYDDGVWVTKGCGGEFVVGSTHEAGGPPPPAAAAQPTAVTQEPTGVSNFIVGGEWFFAKNGKIYTESRIDNGSVTANGENGYDVFTIGFRYDFSLRLSHEQ